CRGKGAGRRGGVKDAVVRATEEFANANARLVAGDRCDEQVATGFAKILRGSQRSREHHGSRVQNRTVVQIILLHQMGAGSVYQRSEIGRTAAAADQDARRTRSRSHLLRVALKQWDTVRASAGQCR